MTSTSVIAKVTQAHWTAHHEPMRQFLGHWRSVAIVLGAISTMSWLGWDLLVDEFGARAVIGQAAPILLAFLPGIGVGLIVGSVVLLCGLVTSEVRAWGGTRCSEITRDLTELNAALDFLNRRHKPINEPQDRERRARYTRRVISAKYETWLRPTRPDGITPPAQTVQDRSAHIAQVFRTHGYFRGYRELRRLLRMV